MNVSSSSTTSNAANTSSANTATAVKTREGASFEQEMQNVDKQSQEQNNQDNTAVEIDKKNDTEQKQPLDDKQQDVVLSGLIKAESEDKFNSVDLLSLNIQQLLDTQNQLNCRNEVIKGGVSTVQDLSGLVGQSLSMDVVEMNDNDALFFADVVKNNEIGIQNVVQDIQQAMEFGSESVQKAAMVSKTLLNALANTAKTGQAVRIDFGNDVAVVMRINKDGSIMANFIPGDKAVEEYLKNNIEILKQRFEEEDIKYSQRSYSNHQQKERKQQENNKENKHE